MESIIYFLITVCHWIDRLNIYHRLSAHAPSLTLTATAITIITLTDWN